jgi:hypothetical protein
MVTNGNYLGNLGQKKAENYYCKCCDYTTCYESKMKRHLNTKKHNDNHMVTNGNYLGRKGRKGRKNANNKWKCGCGKSYKYKSGLSRHKTTCAFIEEDTEGARCLLIKKENNGVVCKDEIIMKLLEQNAELMKKLENTTTINGNNNNMNMNSNNTNFNIQLYLNENCKNATSIQDFAKQLKITMRDVSLLKDNEPKAITNIITKNLKDYATAERPFHHHKEKWYIKDDKQGWDNKGDNKGEKIIKNVKNQLSKTASIVFIKNNPNFLKDDKQGTAYAETMVVAMKDVNKKDSKKVLKSLKDECSV